MGAWEKNRIEVSRYLSDEVDTFIAVIPDAALPRSVIQISSLMFDGGRYELDSGSTLRFARNDKSMVIDLVLICGSLRWRLQGGATCGTLR